ncbi:MAG TPA: PPOX class F420-dependent oxidoreductase [Actinomycetota bacterium]|jgi:PPOX class probable F420-dependent enzyme|nr:PPOX class F420-dependent oxidoreductase [Actinomycetota bacterium]
MDLDEARTFIKENPRGVLATERRDGRPQMSPIVAAVDDQGRLLISTRETAYKTKNVGRNPDVSLCFMNPNFFGNWIQVDGTVEIISLPEAMALLIDYYRRLSGEHDDWDDYRAAMERDRRLIMRVTIERAGPDRSG